VSHFHIGSLLSLVNVPKIVNVLNVGFTQLRKGERKGESPDIECAADNSIVQYTGDFAQYVE